MSLILLEKNWKEINARVIEPLWYKKFKYMYTSSKLDKDDFISLAHYELTKAFKEDYDKEQSNIFTYATNVLQRKAKTELMAQRIMDINPLAEVQVLNSFYSAENREVFTLGHIDYLVDAIDSVASKIDLIQQAQERNIPIISSMGTGNKLNPAELEVADIYKTTVCPLARVMRQRLKKAGIKKLKVVYSKEKPLEHQPIPEEFHEDAAGDRPTVGSVAFVPSVAGLIIASEVVKDLCAFAV